MVYAESQSMKSNDKLGGYVKYLLYPKGGGYRVGRSLDQQALSKLTKTKEGYDIKSCRLLIN
jgi:hypothetical protein